MDEAEHCALVLWIRQQAVTTMMMMVVVMVTVVMMVVITMTMVMTPTETVVSRLRNDDVLSRP